MCTRNQTLHFLSSPRPQQIRTMEQYRFDHRKMLSFQHSGGQNVQKILDARSYVLSRLDDLFTLPPPLQSALLLLILKHRNSQSQKWIIYICHCHILVYNIVQHLHSASCNQTKNSNKIVFDSRNQYFTKKMNSGTTAMKHHTFVPV